MAEYRDTIYGLMLVALMAFRPDGILSADVMKWFSNHHKKQNSRTEKGE
jgi:branched-chain amino acid transport system permease protein